MKRRALAALLGGSMLTGACFSLDVSAIQPTNGTAYTREDVLRDPALIELVIGGVFVNLWGGLTADRPWTVLGVLGEEMTTSILTAGDPVWDFVQEPRPQYNNQLTDGNRIARDGWANFYEANAAAVEFVGYLNDNNLRVIDKNTGLDNTERLRAFSKWISGISHIYLGLLYDSAAVVNEAVDLSRIPVLPFTDYKEVIDSGIRYLEEAIEIADNNTFIYPLNTSLWIYNTGVTNIQLAQTAHTFIARGLVYQARTPEERNAIDWAKVKEHTQKGVDFDFGPRGRPNPLITFLYRISTTAAPINISSICNGECSRPGQFRVDTRIVGPADTTGIYQEWLGKVAAERFDTVAPITVSTPDQRIQAATMTSPIFKPAYFKYTDRYPPQTAMDTTLRGKYYVSFYWNSTRALDNRTQFPRDGGGRNENDAGDLRSIQDVMVLAVENRLLQAEAEIHLNNLQAAADIINESRVVNGELDPVTTSGVPAGPSCVPRAFDGSQFGRCGTLMESLMYEKRLETYGTAVAFFDARGWGCLAEGTFLHLPVPGRQLDLMGKTIYTFGGKPGEPGNAPKPTSCPLLWKP